MSELIGIKMGDFLLLGLSLENPSPSLIDWKMRSPVNPRLTLRYGTTQLI
jgi:hypothetical protein